MRALLDRLPGLTCLVTSRRRLDLEGEREFRVEPLPTPNPGLRSWALGLREGALGVGAWALGGDAGPATGNDFSRPKAQGPRPKAGDPRVLPEQLVAYPSVQLFVDRAQAVRPDFQVTAANASAVAELCRRLEGIPLALELAAARIQVLTPAQMLLQLERRLDFLTSRRRDASARQYIGASAP